MSKRIYGGARGLNKSILSAFNSIDHEEECWETGNYSDLCICEMCPHKDECSGYDKEEDE